MLQQQRSNFIRKWANKLGITKYINLDITEVQSLSNKKYE
ncbi:unnamed protein product [marine sediment metagenome]|uniref:Uncharacterized protein n=1 Tax=marine sediment metagenome TaxID=412755 RepID=X1D9U7_9ZZZZ